MYETLFLLLYTVIMIRGHRVPRSTSLNENGMSYLDQSGGQAPIFRIQEEMANGTVIQGVSEYLRRFTRYATPQSTFSIGETYEFQLLGLRTALTAALHLASTSGELMVIGRIDREVLCPSTKPSTKLLDLAGYQPELAASEDCIKTLEILATPKAASLHSEVRKAAIKLHIEDINDNNPQWAPTHVHNTMLDVDGIIRDRKLPVIEVRLLETAKSSDIFAIPSTAIPLPLAHDPDAGMNGIVHYRIEPQSKTSDVPGISSPYFPFELQRNGDGSLELLATGALDYEQQKTYHFYLIAEDYGTPVRSARALVKVNLVDVNDEEPVFTKEIFYPESGSVSEKTAPGTVLLNLSAHDADASVINNRLRYALSSTPAASEFFTVHSDGRVMLRQWLDYEAMELSSGDPVPGIDIFKTMGTRKWFAFRVEAVDSAPVPYEKKGYATVIIPVRDENDEAPVITTKFFGSPEATNNGRIGAVVENSNPPTRLAYIQVRDPDFDGQDRVTCQLGDSVNFSLTAVPSTPQRQPAPPFLETHADFVLNLLGSIDREQKAMLQVSLKCTDDASNTNEQTLRIRVLDVNDEIPTFTQTTYHFTLPENSEPNTLISPGEHSSSTNLYGYRVGSVIAYDRDMGRNAQLHYRLESNSLQIVRAQPFGHSSFQLHNKPNNIYWETFRDREPMLDDLFHIGEQTGVLHALKSFDAESIVHIRMKVLALDQPDVPGATPLTGRATIEVKIVDVNDCDPVFYQTNASQLDNAATKEMDPVLPVSQYEFHVSENRPAYWLAGRVAALDLDISAINRANESFTRMSNVNLRISPVAELEVRKTFSLHRTSGQLRTLAPLDRERNAVYMFTVIATDGFDGKADLERSATATVTVFVDDENDNDPVFVRPTAAVEEVTTTIDAKAGQRIDTPELRVETQGEHENGVVVRDKRIPDRNVPIVLVDKQRIIRQLENAAGTPLLQLEARDADAGDNGRITYRIGAGNNDRLFSLDNITGTLSFSPAVRNTRDEAARSNLDTYTPIQGKRINYLLRFEACDNGTPKRCALPIWTRVVFNLEDLIGIVPLQVLTGEVTNDRYSNEGIETHPSFQAPDGVGLSYNQRVGAQTQQDWRFKDAMEVSSSNDLSQTLHGHDTAVRNWKKNNHVYSSNSISFDVDGRIHRVNHQPTSLIVNEAVIICLVIIFAILLAGAAILLCLLKKRFMIYTFATKRKMKIASGKAMDNGDAASNNVVEDSSCAPNGLTASSSLYRSILTTIPNGQDTSDMRTPLCNTEVSDGNKAVCNMRDMMGMHSLARRNSEPTLESTSRTYNSVCVSKTTQPAHASQLMERRMGQSNLWYHNGYPVSYVMHHPDPRSITPCFETGQDDSFCLDQRPGNANSFHSSPRLMYQPTSPQPGLQRYAGMEFRDESHFHAWPKNAPAAPYVCVSPSLDQAIHSRGDSLPVNPADTNVQFNAMPNWPSTIMDHSHTYQELSALTASLHRNPKSIHLNRRNLRTLDNRISSYGVSNHTNHSFSPSYYQGIVRDDKAFRLIAKSPVLNECDEHMALLRNTSDWTSTGESTERSRLHDESQDSAVKETSAVDLEESQISHTLQNPLTESSSTSGIASEQLTAQKSPGAKYIYDAYREASFV